MISRSNLNLVYLGSKSSSHAKMIGNMCEHFRGHRLSPIKLKIGQSIYLDDFFVKIESGCR